MKVHTQPMIASVSRTVSRPTRAPRATTVNESLSPLLTSEVEQSVGGLLNVELEVVIIVMSRHSFVAWI